MSDEGRETLLLEAPARAAAPSEPEPTAEPREPGATPPAALAAASRPAETPRASRRGGSNGQRFALGAALAALVACLLTPAPAPGDAAAAGKLPPLTRVAYLVTLEGEALPLVRRDASGAIEPGSWRLEGSEVIASRGLIERRVPLATLALDEAGAPRARERWHLLGTDRLGRDLLARLLAAGRTTLLVSSGGVLGAALIALLLGLGAALAPGWLDALLARSADGLLAMPRLLLLMPLGALLAPSPLFLALLLALSGWAGLFRLVRAEGRTLARSELALSARAAGAGALRLARVHLLPHVLPTLLVGAALRVGPTVALESSLSFLGVGLRPPASSWGLLLAEGRDALADAWWIATFAGLAVVLLSLGAHALIRSRAGQVV